jgi:hypothetical protein
MTFRAEPELLTGRKGRARPACVNYLPVLTSTGKLVDFARPVSWATLKQSHATTECGRVARSTRRRA